MQQRSVAISLGIVGIKFDGFVIVDQRFNGIALFKIHSTTGQVVDRIFREELHKFIEFSLGSLEVFHLNICNRLVNKHLTVFGLKLKSFCIIGNGTFVIILTLPCNTPAVVGLY